MHIHARCNDTECVETEPVRNQDRFFKQLLPISHRMSGKGGLTHWFRDVKNHIGNLSTREFMMHSGTHTFRNCELQRFNSSRNFIDLNKEFEHSQSFEHASKQNREFLTCRTCEHIDAEDSNLQRCNNSRHYKDLNKRSQPVSNMRANEIENSRHVEYCSI